MAEQTPALYVDSGGALKPVAPDEVAGAEQLGWTPASPEQAQQFALQQKYGGTGSQIKTALTGAGDVLTFGGVSAARRALGTPTEQLRGEEEANPLSHAAGELAGFGVGAFVPGLDEVSAPGAIAKVGAGVAEHVAPAVVTKALTGAAGLGAKALRGAVALGTEGALYGAQQVAHEAVLQDPALTAESAVATVIGSALAGGVLGGGAGVLGHLAGGIHASDFGARVADMAKEAEGFSNLNATNAMPAEIKALIKRKSDAIAIGREGRDLGIIVNPLVDSSESILERAENVAKAAGEKIDKIAADSAAAGAPVTNFNTIRQQVEAPITAALRKQGATFALADQFVARMDQYAQAYAGRDLDLPGVLGLKRDLAQFIYTNKSTFDVWAREINTPLSRALEHVSELVEDGVKNSLGKDALKALQAANREAEVALTFKTLAQSGISRAAANNPVHLSGMMGAVAGASALGPGGLALGLVSEAARRRGASATGYLARSAADLMGSGVPANAAVGALAKNNARVQAAIKAATAAAVHGEADAVSHAAAGDSRALYDKRVKSVRAASSPEKMLQDITAHTQGMHDHAPQVASQYGAAHTRAVQYLASQIPPTVDRGILAPAQDPSAAQVRKFNAAYDAVTDPIAVVHAAGAGQASPQQIAALAAVYPALHKAVAAAALEHIAKAGVKAVPRAQHAALQALTGERLNASVSGPQILRTQAALAPRPMQAPAGVGKPLGAAKALTLGTRALTQSQASAIRR
jgi:hypothetical protein